MKVRFLNRRGIALILVILVTSVIVALTVQFNRSSRIEISETANLSDRIKLLYVAKSGFYEGEARLLNDQNNYDSLTEDWSDTASVSQKSADLFTGSSYQLDIEDESGKIPISLLIGPKGIRQENQDLLVRLLSLPEFGLSEEQILLIMKSVKELFSQGQGNAADSFSGFNLFMNGNLDSLDQLLLIKGVTPDLYYGTETKPGLIQCLSIYGEGKININTAPKIVLRALSDDVTPEVAERLDDYRRTKGVDLSDPKWCERLPGLVNVHFNAQQISTQSNVFKITSTGRIGNMTEVVSGVIKRVPATSEIKLLSWRAE
ncbi:MAG: hypothetical protein ABSB79_09665 [Syntrophales bacterium]